jgi:hypothetical protein
MLKKNYKTVEVVYGVQIILLWWRLHQTAEWNASKCAKRLVHAAVTLRLNHIYNTCDLVTQNLTRISWFACYHRSVICISHTTPAQTTAFGVTKSCRAVFPKLYCSRILLIFGKKKESSHPCHIATHHVTRHNTSIHNIVSTAPQLSICQKALGTLPEDGNVMTKRVGDTIHN